MAQKNSFSQKDINMMLNIVAKKMGTTPESLQEQLQAGQVNDQKANEILNNKEELQKVLNSPQVKKLLEELKK